MVNIKENVNIKGYSTFKVGGSFRYFTVVQSVGDLMEAISFSKEKGVKLFVLGGGSNVIFSDGIVDVLALKMEIEGFEIVNETNAYVDIKVGAGVVWDKFVERVVDMGLCGVEAMSFIPGTVGAGPIQNVGAYGSEVKDVMESVEVLDIESREIKTILNVDCKFGYRDSIFKNEARGKYIITNVTYRLSKSIPSIPKYPGVIKYFEDREITNPTLKEIRDAIISIRKEKLPDPREIPNTGSFFKNPIVSNEVAERIKIDFPDAKFFPVDESHTKVPAGWLIENVGLKGESFGNVSVYNKNALVLVNNGSANFEDVIKARTQVIRAVKERFGITLEQEPEII